LYTSIILCFEEVFVITQYTPVDYNWWEQIIFCC